MKKENKRKFNIFVSILTCFIITLACLSPSFNSYANENFDLIEMLDIQDTFITASDLGDGSYSFFVQDNSYEQNYHDMYSNGFNYNANNAVSNQLNSLDFSKYVGAYKSDFSQFILYYLPENSFIVQNNQRAIIFAEVQYSDVGAGYNAGFPVFRSSDGVQFSVDWQTVGFGSTVDGVSYSTIGFSTSDGAFDNICSCNIPVYYYDSYDFNFSTLSDLEQLDNPIIDSGSDDIGSAENYLYIDDGGVNFSVQGLTSGYVTLWFKPNEYLEEHSEDFTFNYKFSSSCNVVDNTLMGKKYHINGASNGIQSIPLSQIMSNDCSLGFLLSDIERQLPVNTGNVETSALNSIFEVYDYYGNGVSSSNPNLPLLNLKKVNWYSATLNVYFWITENNSDNSSGRFAEQYDFLKGKQDNLTDSIKTNYNPYNSTTEGSVDNDDDIAINDSSPHVTSDNIPTSNGGGNSSSNINNSGNITINNNVGGGYGSNGTSDSSVSNFFLTFNPVTTFFTKLIGDNQTTAEDLTENVGINNWFTIINQTYSWIPTPVWSTLLTCFITCMGIVVIAFIIRIILDLL